MSILTDFLTLAIGLVFIYWLLSILTSYILELISNAFQLRGKNLADGIHRLLEPSSQELAGAKKIGQAWQDGRAIWDKGVVQAAGENYHRFVADKMNENLIKAFYSHPLVTSQSKPGKLPSYIDAAIFSSTLIDLFSQAGSDETQPNLDFLASIKAGLAQMNDHSLKVAILPIIENAERVEADATKRIALFKSSLETWFNGTMVRCAGWYKRRVTLIGILVGLVIAVALNADTIGVAQALWRDGVLRQSIADAATSAYQEALTQGRPGPDTSLSHLSALSIPMGWSGRLASQDPAVLPNPQDFPSEPGSILSKLAGWLITGLAISQGSTVWFDALQKLINLRGSGGKP